MRGEREAVGSALAFFLLVRICGLDFFIHNLSEGVKAIRTAERVHQFVELRVITARHGSLANAHLVDDRENQIKTKVARPIHRQVFTQIPIMQRTIPGIDR